MTGNRSLDEFAGSDAPGEATDPGSEEKATPKPEPADSPARDSDSADVESIESTYDWTPGGAPCAMCGDAVEERWRDSTGLVCIECKVW